MRSERLKLFFYSLLFFLFFGLLTLLITLVEYSSYKTTVNNYLYGMIELLQENYPSITEKEIIELLNGKENTLYKENLRKYGIEEDTSVLTSLEQNYKMSSILNCTFTLSMVCVLVFCFFWYFAKKEHQIKEITNYMKEINHRNYLLNIEDNEEGELSILKNEVYKTTIMLREESEILKKEKLSLKDSISDISHQLKTPLTSILIMLDNILDNPKMDEKTKLDFIENVRHQVETINFLIVSLLKLSRIDAGVIEFKKENINYEILLKNAIKNVEILNEVKNIKIMLDIEKETIFLGDYNWELEAITNILKNAIEHSLAEGKIEIKVEDNPLFTKLTIKDDGCGMSKKDLQNIFKRFYKGENSKNDSIGIGLNLAKNIIEKDGGMIKVASEVGKGTTFEIKFMK